MLKFALLWHMHQPDYRNAEGVMQMPWVFLHAIKDYYDMPWMMSRYPNQKATFNLTPTLIEQLELYGAPLEHDYFLQLWSQHPSELGSTEREWIVKICKSCHYDTMVRPLKRFAELYPLQQYEDDAFNDLQVQFVLAWCGVYLRTHNATVRKMLEQERNYSQQDKAALLLALSDFIATILPHYRSLMEAGKITLSTTPLTHPILPLLIDMNNAKQANPHAPMPEHPVSLEDDARRHVSGAIELYERHFGQHPSGFWPAEGAVDERSVAIYREQGLKWIATDEAILFKSLDEGVPREALFAPYRFNGMTLTFRDQGLSNLIGFDYRHYPAQEAAHHFMTRLQHIHADHADATVSVILDGENAWEYFEANAYPFFSHFYETLEANASWCRCVTMDEVTQLEAAPLSRLSPGSWIRGDFTTWAGHSEKNRAWELVFQARRDFLNREMAFETEVLERIQRHFLELECSDWYWWYGDDHVTEFALEFDALFRKHLIEIYTLMRMNPPSDLFEPLLEHISTASFMVRPQSPIQPKIDGLNNSFFEWIGAGSIDESRLYSTMERDRGPVEMIHYGYGADGTLYISFAGDIGGLCRDKCRMHIITEETGKRVTLGLLCKEYDEPFRVRVGERIEMKIPREFLGTFGAAHLRFEIECGDRILQTMPGFGSLAVDEQIDYHQNWFV